MSIDLPITFALESPAPGPRTLDGLLTLTLAPAAADAAPQAQASISHAIEPAVGKTGTDIMLVSPASLTLTL